MEEISLRELIEILIKRKKIICLITVLSVLVAGIFSFFVITPKYEAKMILMTSNINEELKSGNGSEDGNVGNVLNAITQYPSMNLETYRQQIKTPEVMEKTIKDLNLENEYTVESLSEKIDLETVDETELITIKMQHEDPEKVAKIINKVGENFVEVVSQNTRERSSEASKNIKEQMDIEKKKYDEYLLELKELLSQPRRASELELELDAKLEQITNYKIALNDLSIRKDALSSSINVAEKDPSISNVILVKPNLNNATYYDVIKKDEEGNENGNEKMKVVPKRNSLISNSMNLLSGDSKEILKIESAEVEGSMKSIIDKIAEMQSDIEKLQVELQEKKHEESIVKQKVDIAQKTYEAFVKKYEELKVTEASKIGEASITVISKAHPSTKPVAPRKALNVAISLVLGLMIGMLTAFFQEYWNSTNKETEMERQ